MAYQLIYTKSALKDIKRLDTVSKKKLKKKIETYAQKPLSYAKKLTNYRLGSYRWRIGNYRVIFDIIGQKIVFLRIGHRREVYKK